MPVGVHEASRTLRSMRIAGILCAASMCCTSSACGRPAESTEVPTASAAATNAPGLRSSTEPAIGTPPAAPASASAASPATFGEKITASLVPLAEIAAHPSRFQNDVVATSGKVTAVCQERGCWMELADASGKAHVRMHGHSFFVPRTAPGHTARVQARLVPARGGGMDCESDGKDPNGTARVELDATGVEID